MHHGHGHICYANILPFIIHIMFHFNTGICLFHSACHAEMNAIIAAFRRSADLSSCTLYVTHSPCEDCSKLIAQSGIKNVVFAKYYHKGKDLYEQLGHLPDMNIT